MPREPMLRRQVYLTKAELTLLNRLARSTGMTASEHIRRAIDAYLKDKLAPKR